MTAKRSLRLSVPEDLAAEVTKYAAVWKVNKAECAVRLLAAGVAMWESIVDREMRRYSDAFVTSDSPLCALYSQDLPGQRGTGTNQSEENT